jgi:hypothetical protein
VRIAVMSESARVSDADLQFMAEACHRQAIECADAWSLPRIVVSFYRRGTDLPPATTNLMSIVDTIDVDSALGYHTDYGGIIYGLVLAQDTVGTGVTLSHEILEMLVDPDAEEWRGDVALEVCDPVEADVYQSPPVTILGETRQVLLSNYVYPAWFDVAASGPYDRMGKLTAPLAMTSGGYVIKRNPDGTSRTVFARTGDVPASWYRKLINPKSRTMGRLRAVGALGTGA